MYKTRYCLRILYVFRVDSHVYVSLLWTKVELDDIKEIIAGNIKNNMEISSEVKIHQVGSDIVGRSIEEPVTTELCQPLLDTDTNNK